MEIRPTLKVTVPGILMAAVFACAVAVRILFGTMLVSAGAEPTPASDSNRAQVLREVAKKFGTGEKITPHEFHDFVDAQNHAATTGLKVGQKVPDFTLPDQNSMSRKFADLVGPSGLLLVFSRSADW